MATDKEEEKEKAIENIRITDVIKTIKGKKIKLTEYVANVEDVKKALFQANKSPKGK